jgi:hypothetical protein
MNARRFVSFAVAGLAVVFLARPVAADFSGPYTFAPNEGGYFPWQFPNGTNFTMAVGTWTLTATIDPVFRSTFYPTMIDMPDRFYFNTGPPNMSGFSHFEDISLTHAIAADGILSFDYSISLGTSFAPGTFDVAGYTINGSLTVLPAGTGSVSVPVNEGQVFGFFLSARGECLTCQPIIASQVEMNVTNFSAPVPEPATTTLFVCGAGLALAGARLRSRAREVVDRVDQQLRTF